MQRTSGFAADGEVGARVWLQIYRHTPCLENSAEDYRESDGSLSIVDVGLNGVSRKYRDVDPSSQPVPSLQVLEREWAPK